jgi:hypothetical protein
MSRVIVLSVLLGAATLGCSSSTPAPANEMAPNPRLDPQAEARTAPVAARPGGSPERQ